MKLEIKSQNNQQAQGTTQITYCIGNSMITCGTGEFDYIIQAATKPDKGTHATVYSQNSKYIVFCCNNIISCVFFLSRKHRIVIKPTIVAVVWR